MIVAEQPSPSPRPTMDQYYRLCLLKGRELIKRYAALGQRFNKPVDDWSEDNPPVKVRQEINRLAVPIKLALRNIGMTYTMSLIDRNKPLDLDLPTDLFFLEDYGGFTGWDLLFDKLERAIGVYEHRLQSGLAIHDSVTESDDYVLRLSAVLQKALRPAFRSAPNDELQIQDVIRGILLAAGFEYFTSHGIPFGPGAVRPDFYFPEARVALEVKYARSGNVRRLIAEMSDDVTRYNADTIQRVLFLVYGFGQVAKVAELIGAFAPFEEVRVAIVKH